MITTDKTGASRVERKKEDTKQKIIAAAMDSFIRQGFEATSMEQIAEQADIAKGTLYNYFPVKEAILDEFMKRRFQDRSPEWISKLSDLPDTRSRICLIFSELLVGVQAQPVIFEKYIIYRMRLMVSFHYQDDSEKSGLYRVIREILNQGQQSGELRSDLPGHLLEDLCEFAFIEAAKQFYLEPEGFERDQVAAQCVDLFMKGAGAAR